MYYISLTVTEWDRIMYGKLGSNHHFSRYGIGIFDSHYNTTVCLFLFSGNCSSSNICDSNHHVFVGSAADKISLVVGKEKDVQCVYD